VANQGPSGRQIGLALGLRGKSWGNLLGGDKRLLLLALDDGIRLDVLLGGGGEVVGLVLLGGLGGDFGRSGSAADELLSLGGVVAHVLLGDLGGMGRVLAGHVANLAGLGIDNIRRLLNMVVDELLVGRIDERDEEQRRGEDQSEAPVRDDLDEPVGDEGRKEGL